MNVLLEDSYKNLHYHQSRYFPAILIVSKEGFGQRFLYLCRFKNWDL